MIVNGRTPGDMLEAYTLHGYNGSSCIDLCICNTNIYDNVQFFRVHENAWFTDHCCIGVCLKVGKIPSSQSDNYPLLCFPVKFKWNEAGQVLFRDMMCSNTVRDELISIKNSNVSGKQSINILTDLLCDVANSPKYKLEGNAETL